MVVGLDQERYKEKELEVVCQKPSPMHAGIYRTPRNNVIDKEQIQVPIV